MKDRSVLAAGWLVIGGALASAALGGLIGAFTTLDWLCIIAAMVGGLFLMAREILK